MDAPERVVFTRGRYRLVEWVAAPDARTAGSVTGALPEYRIVDGAASVIESVDCIEAGFLRIDQLLAMDRAVPAIDGLLLPSYAASERRSPRR